IGARVRGLPRTIVRDGRDRATLHASLWRYRIRCPDSPARHHLPRPRPTPGSPKRPREFRTPLLPAEPGRSLHTAMERRIPRRRDRTPSAFRWGQNPEIAPPATHEFLPRRAGPTGTWKAHL